MPTDRAIAANPMETERLIIRPYQTSDLHQFLTIAQEHDIGIIPSSSPSGTGLFLAERWIKNVQSSMSAGTAYEFAVIEKKTTLLVGTAGFVRVDRVHLVGEFGVWMSARFRQRGYATEAARAVIRFGFEKLHLKRIAARTDGDNDASIRLMQKLKFKPSVGLRRQLTRTFVDENVIRWELHSL